MTPDRLEKRNFLFFLHRAHAPKAEDSLIGALARPSSWDAVSDMIRTARQTDPSACSVRKVYLYVHVPFCGKLCTFCGCNKVLLQRRSDIDEFIVSLTRQMMLRAPAYEGMSAPLLAFGGGTPSILSTEQLDTLLDGVDKAFPARDRELHFEISPATWTEEKLALLAGRGMKRLSIGVQSMDDQVLKQVSRPQDSRKAVWCVRSAREAGIPNVNVDLIAGLPGQTVEGLLEDLRLFIAEGANIIHVHPLTGPSLKGLCGPGESVPEFFRRRDTMMTEAIQILREEGFHCTIPDGEARDFTGEAAWEELYNCYETALAAFGPFAIGQFPGAVHYSTAPSASMADMTAVNAAAQNSSYLMSHYAALEIIRGLDEKAFLRRFGVPLESHCGKGLRFMQEFGLVECSQGVWKFSGEWEFRRVREFYAFTRALFGDALLLRLRLHYRDHYDPRRDYSGGSSLLNDYADSSLLGIYYNRRPAEPMVCR